MLKLKIVKSSLFLAIAIVGAVAIEPAIPAEKIKFNYSLLGFSIKVADLAAFAETGEVSNSLNFYLKRIPPQQREKLQKFLQQSYNVDPILVYRYSRTSAGIKMLQRIGEIIQLPGNLNGFYGLRAAVVQAAASKSGINLVDFLKLFPTDIRLDLGELLELVEQVSSREKETKEFIASISSDTTESKSDLKDIPNLSNKGQYRVIKQTLELYDRSRDRTLNTDFYLPETKSDRIPVIVVSNGLGAKRDRFKGLANHLASHGFAVAIPDHPGSDRRRQKAFLKGLYKENFDATDYIDRPLDISYILDELDRLDRRSLDNKLDLQQVGVFGYSIGGTTALSLAGAELDFEKLKQDCDRPLDLLNISILYQCRALELSPQQPSLKDERVKAAFLFVPFGNSLFSQEELGKISTPVMWQVVDRDFLTSLLDEQVPLFNSLGSDRYLVVSQKIPHSNVTLSNQQQSSQASAFDVARTYQNILSLVFFKNYIAENKEYQSYLSSEYIQAIEQEPYELHLIKEQ